MHGSAKSSEKRPVVFGCIDFFSGSVASMANVLGDLLNWVSISMIFNYNSNWVFFHLFQLVIHWIPSK